jgi:hypothetical protein
MHPQPSADAVVVSAAAAASGFVDDERLRAAARIDPSRNLAYNLEAARFYDLPRSDGIGAFKENPQWNQYWYGEGTVAAILRELALSLPAGARVAFVSCPSLFFGLPAAVRAAARHALLEIDVAAFGSTPGFVLYDHCHPEALPAALAGQFDAVCLDPPLISPEVWELTARTARHLLGARGRAVIASTVPGNAPLLARLFGATRVRFRPELPHLVHSFVLFVAGFEPRALCEENPDAPGDGRVGDGSGGGE